MVHLFLLFFFASSPLAETSFESCIQPWGIDSDLTIKKVEKQVESQNTCHYNSKKCSNIAVKTSVSMIRFFQKYISPIDGPRSHYYPSSSQYALTAIQKYGVLKGIALGCDRLLRENNATWVYTIKNEKKVDPVR